MKSIITLCASIFLLCLSCCQKSSDGPIIFEAKILEWKTGDTYPVGDNVLESYGNSKIEIMNPEKWRGETVEVLVSLDSTELWSSKGEIINIHDTHGEMVEYLENKHSDVENSKIIFDAAFSIEKKHR